MSQKELSKYAKQFHYYLNYHFGLCGLNHPKNLHLRPKSKRLFDLARITKNECAYEKWDSAKHNLPTLVGIFDAGLKGAMGYYIIPCRLGLCGYVYQLGKAFSGFAQEYDECRLHKAVPAYAAEGTLAHAVLKGHFDGLAKSRDAVTAPVKIADKKSCSTAEYWEKQYRQLKEAFDIQDEENRSNLDAASRKIFALERKLDESAAVVDELAKEIQKQAEIIRNLSDSVSIREENNAKLQKATNNLTADLHRMSKSRRTIIDALVELIKTHSS